MGLNPYSSDQLPFAMQPADIGIEVHPFGLVVDWSDSVPGTTPGVPGGVSVYDPNSGEYVVRGGGGELDPANTTVRYWEDQGVTAFKVFRREQQPIDLAPGQPPEIPHTLIATVPVGTNTTADTVPAQFPGRPFSYAVVPVNDLGYAVRHYSEMARAVPIALTFPLLVYPMGAYHRVYNPTTGEVTRPAQYFARVQWSATFPGFGFILRRNGVVIAAGPVDGEKVFDASPGAQEGAEARQGLTFDYNVTDGYGYRSASGQITPWNYATDVGPPGPFARTLPGDATKIRRWLDDTPLVIGDTYTYQVSLVPYGYANWTNDGAIYAESDIYTYEARLPDVSGSVTITGTPGYRQAIVEWTVELGDVEFVPWYYNVYMDGVQVSSILAATHGPLGNGTALYENGQRYSATVTGLTNGDPHDFYVRVSYRHYAGDAYEGPPSNTVSITPVPPGGNLVAAPPAGAPFEWDDIALPAAVVDANGPLGGVGVIRWRFVDPADASVYTVPFNPNKMTSPFPPRAMSTAATTGVDSRPLVFEGGLIGHEWSFSGVILDKAHLDALLFWSKKQNRFFIFDHLGRRFTVAPRQLDATPALRSMSHYWRHDYTFSVYVLAVN